MLVMFSHFIKIIIKYLEKKYFDSPNFTRLFL